MSEVQSRPHGTRGRGSYRGGRGGYRGARNGTKSHTRAEEQDSVPATSLEDQGEVGELKRKYGSKVPLLREVCPGWSDEDLVFALNETEGNVDLAFDRISSGSVSQWGEVKKKQPKPKEAPASTENTGTARGARGRGNVEGRGRGRGTERGRSRSGRGASQTNGARNVAKPAEDTWGEPAAAASEAIGGWDAAGAADVPSALEIAPDPNSDGVSTVPIQAEEFQAAGAPPATKKGGWAGLFKPTPAPQKKPSPTIPVAQPEDIPPAIAQEQELPPELLPPTTSSFADDGLPKQTAIQSTEAPLELTPSKDELTEENVERLPDSSNPPPSQTAASTVASTQDPLSSTNIATPVEVPRPPLSGYAASALKATATGRSASFTRRVLEQQEAVVMPGNQAVDRAAVQFGSMGLNSPGDDIDVDEDREEPETRTQMPDDSPAAPRASLPPSHQEVEATAPARPATGEAQTTQRQAPGLPATHQTVPQTSTPPTGPSYGDAYRYGQAGQKAYDPFGPQPNAPPQSQAAAPSQEPFSNQIPSQAQPQLSSAPDYSSYYPASARDPYQGYYGSYGHAPEAQPRSGSAFGTSSQDMPGQYTTSRPQHVYGGADAQNSGHNTPNPALQGHHAPHSQHVPHNQSYGGYPHGYSAYGQQFPQYGSYGSGRYGPSRPAFDDVRRQDPTDYYSNQYAYGQNQHFGGYNKANMYGPTQQQYSYEQTSSPANAGSYGQTSVTGRDNLYGRTGSTQPSESQQTPSNSAFMPDPFGRSHSGFGQQHSSTDDTKYDTTKASGPSPSVGQSNRPGSAVNSLSAQTQQSTGFAPTQSQTGQHAFGGYPQYGGHQGQSSHPQSTYSGYGSNTFATTYGGYGSGRGWNGTYGGAH